MSNMGNIGRATIRIPTPLRAFTGGASEVTVRATTVGQALEQLGRAHAGLLERVLNGDGQVRGFVNIYLGDREHLARWAGSTNRAAPTAAVISIVPAVAGGRS